MQERDFKSPVFSRGGIVHLAWKGEEARQIELLARLENDGKKYEWTVRLNREGYEFSVQENVSEIHKHVGPTQLLWADRGRVGGGPAQKETAFRWHSRRRPVPWLPPRWTNHFQHVALQSS